MSSDRHARVDRVCEQCEREFTARVERVNKGQGRFCSLKCANIWQSTHSKKLIGKENGKKYWDGGAWKIHWYDEDGKVHVTTYQRWWWEINNDTVLPKDLYIVLKDGNPENISPDNFVIMSKKDLSIMRGHNGLGSPKPTNSGENNKWWRGGVSQGGYPQAFTKPLKKRIKIRDGYTCQCCYSGYSTENLDVHHIDRNIQNNTPDNLVTVCKSCHKGIHGRSSKTNDKIRYYQSLLGE